MKFLALLVLLSGCAHHRPGPVRQTQPVLQRGWAYIEPEKDFINQETGSAQVSYSAPLVVDDKLVFGSDRFGITVLNKKNGKLIWQKKLRNGVAAQPLVLGKKLFVGTEEGKFYQFNLDSGLENWMVSFSGSVQGAPILAGDRLLVGTADQVLTALDPETGKILWTYRRPVNATTTVRGGGNPALINGSIWMGFSDGVLVALDPRDGSVQREKQFRDNVKFVDLDARVVGWKDGILVSTYDGKLRYMNREGSVLWEFAAGGSRAPMISDNEIIYFPSSDGAVYALSGISGKEIWRYIMPKGVPTSISLQGDKNRVLIVTGSDERMVALDPSNGSLLGSVSFGKNSGSFAPVAVDQESKSFYVLSNFSRVYQFRVLR